MARVRLGAVFAHPRVDALDHTLATLMARYGHMLHRVSFGALFTWLGLLKQFGYKTGSSLLADTVYFGDPDVVVPLLGWWEVAIGLCPLVRPLNRLAILLLLVRLPGTLLALVLKFDVCFESGVLTPTIQGQYLIKDATLFFAAMVIGATVREEKRPGHYH